jgi:hypothetical protein
LPGSRPTVTEVSDRQVHYLRSPPRPGDGVCEVCWTFCTGWSRCYRCAHDPQWIHAVAPISISVHGGQVHDILWGYKHLDGRPGRLHQRDLIAMLWRYLRGHEACLARRCGVDAFTVVTTVPSSDRERDDGHPLHQIVRDHIGATRDRYQCLLRRSDVDVPPRTVDPAKYDAQRRLDGEPILLIDDTWTTGSNVQSAAGSLVQAGAGPIGVVVAGRHIHDDRLDHSERLRELPRFDWTTCVHHSRIRP